LKEDSPVLLDRFFLVAIASPAPPEAGHRSIGTHTGKVGAASE
jgi:hypothetical protein